MTVTVPAGIDDGQKLRLTYQGDPPPTAGGEAGDLYVHIRVRPDPRFVRDGDNLWVDVPLSFAEAALGTSVQVPTIDGVETIEVTPGTQPMTKQVLPGKGMPNVRGRGRGDLIVRLLVHVPKTLNAEARELVEKLAPHLSVSRSSLTPENNGNDSNGDDSGDGKGKEKEKESVFERILRGNKKKK